MRSSNIKLNNVSSCISCVRSTATHIRDTEGLKAVKNMPYTSFIGYMVAYSPVKPHKFNERTIERALRRVCNEYSFQERDSVTTF